jgi:hypothetical protein
MQASLFAADRNVSYSTKEPGPIILALAFVIVMGGAGIAAVIACGWGHVKSVGINWTRRSAEIVCK